MSVEAKNLCFSYAETQVLHDISFSADAGDLVAVLGPNGVGKSTFFGCLLGSLRPQTGTVIVAGRNVTALSGPDIARQIAYIPQSSPQTFNYPVLDMVLMGLTHEIGLLSAPKAAHIEKAMAAMESLGIAGLAHRGSSQISGGERQLMLLARALVQDAKVLIMDEPTANLDYGNSFRVMQQVRHLGDRGYTVIFSTHEPNQAFRYANRVLALKDGRVLAGGKPEAVLTEGLLTELYGIGVAVRTVQAGDGTVQVSIPYESGEA